MVALVTTVTRCPCIRAGVRVCLSVHGGGGDSNTLSKHTCVCVCVCVCTCVRMVVVVVVTVCFVRTVTRQTCACL